MRVVSNWISAGLGRCPKCMRTSFRFAAMSCLALMLALTFVDEPVLIMAALVAAIIFVAVWTAHLVTYSGRMAQWTMATERSASHARNLVAGSERRRFLGFFMRALAYSATASIASVAVAQDCRCPPQAPECIFNPCRRERFCMPRGFVACAGCKKSWYCNPGHNCLGDGGDGGRCS